MASRALELGMNKAAIIQYIVEAFPNVGAAEASGNYFFFSDSESDHRFPFATLVTGDDYDSASNLSRSGVFRLNIVVRRETYRAIFGPEAPRPGKSGVVETGHDFSALDRIMPHPIYAPQFWLCVLNPSETTFEEIKPLLAEAYEQAARRQARASDSNRA